MFTGVIEEAFSSKNYYRVILSDSTEVSAVSLSSNAGPDGESGQVVSYEKGNYVLLVRTQDFQWVILGGIPEASQRLHGGSTSIGGSSIASGTTELSIEAENTLLSRMGGESYNSLSPIES